MRFQLDSYASPLSTILLVTDDTGTLRALDFAGHESRMHRLLRNHYNTYTLEPVPAPTNITNALDAYFAGNLHALNHLPTATAGTPFQRAVWQALRQIPPGITHSYSQLAKNIAHPTASRAVGAANGANPIALVVPCHRVIGADGTLTGFASGMHRKRWLLDHERRHAQNDMNTPCISHATGRAEKPTRTGFVPSARQVGWHGRPQQSCV